MGRETGFTPPTVEGFADLSVVGRGGFATVYAAVRNSDGTPVALKVFDAADVEGRRIRREASALEVLTGIPYIVPIIGTGTADDGRAVLVMPLYLSSLAHVTSNGGTDPERAVRWLSELALALDGAAAAGVHHRDIKPGNILLDAEDHANLTDFGIASIGDLEASTVTASAFSPPYAAPERLDAAPVDHRRSDIYSLAATIWAVLVGDAPFGTASDGGVSGLISRIMRHELRRPPSMPPELFDVLDRGMALDPAARFATSNEMAEQARHALDSAAEHTTVRAAGAHQPSSRPAAPPSPPAAPLQPPGSPWQPGTSRTPRGGDRAGRTATGSAGESGLLAATEEPPGRRRRRGVLVTAAALLVLIGASVGWFVFGRGDTRPVVAASDHVIALLDPSTGEELIRAPRTGRTNTAVVDDSVLTVDFSSVDMEAGQELVARSMTTLERQWSLGLQRCPGDPWVYTANDDAEGAVAFVYCRWEDGTLRVQAVDLDRRQALDASEVQVGSTSGIQPEVIAGDLYFTHGDPAQWTVVRVDGETGEVTSSESPESEGADLLSVAEVEGRAWLIGDDSAWPIGEDLRSDGSAIELPGVLSTPLGAAGSTLTLLTLLGAPEDGSGDPDALLVRVDTDAGTAERLGSEFQSNVVGWTDAAGSVAAVPMVKGEDLFLLRVNLADGTSTEISLERTAPLGEALPSVQVQGSNLVVSSNFGAEVLVVADQEIRGEASLSVVPGRLMVLASGDFVALSPDRRQLVLVGSDGEELDRARLDRPADQAVAGGDLVAVLTGAEDGTGSVLGWSVAQGELTELGEIATSVKGVRSNVAASTVYALGESELLELSAEDGGGATRIPTDPEVLALAPDPADWVFAGGAAWIKVTEETPAAQAAGCVPNACVSRWDMVDGTVGFATVPESPDRVVPSDDEFAHNGELAALVAGGRMVERLNSSLEPALAPIVASTAVEDLVDLSGGRLALSDRQGNLTIYDRDGAIVDQISSPRPDLVSLRSDEDSLVIIAVYQGRVVTTDSTGATVGAPVDLGVSAEGASGPVVGGLAGILTADGEVVLVDTADGKVSSRTKVFDQVGKTLPAFDR